MAVIGLTERLSLAAGKNVAFGAGAKIVHVTAGKLSVKDIHQLENIPLEMILFCGGYEKGNHSILLHNAQLLSKSKLNVPVIYGGNSSVAQAIRGLFLQHDKECFLVPNIIPNVGELDTSNCETIIRDLFMKRIVNMKGLGKVQQLVKEITPTPAAVLSAGAVLSKGTPHHNGYKDLMIVDIGGATTDIHTYTENTAAEGAKLIGAAEPYSRRTVEGDLGMRESSDTLISEVGLTKIAQDVNLPEQTVKCSIDKRVHDHDFVADSAIEENLDQTIAKSAARIAARRHCGRYEPVHSSNCIRVQLGKNLEQVKTVIGTGGPIINSRNPLEILTEILKKKSKDTYLLLPKEADFYKDGDYILYAAGLLSTVDADFAFEVMENSLKHWYLGKVNAR